MVEALTQITMDNMNGVSNVQIQENGVGLYKTAEVYNGKHDYRSLRLDGLERGFNDNARERAIVIHNADYAGDTFIFWQSGTISWVYFIIDDVSDALITAVKEGLFSLFTQMTVAQ